MTKQVTTKDTQPRKTIEKKVILPAPGKKKTRSEEAANEYAKAKGHNRQKPQ